MWRTPRSARRFHHVVCRGMLVWRLCSLMGGWIWQFLCSARQRPGLFDIAVLHGWIRRRVLAQTNLPCPTDEEAGESEAEGQWTISNVPSLPFFSGIPSSIPEEPSERMYEGLPYVSVEPDVHTHRLAEQLIRWSGNWNLCQRWCLDLTLHLLARWSYAREDREQLCWSTKMTRGQRVDHFVEPVRYADYGVGWDPMNMQWKEFERIATAEFRKYLRKAYKKKCERLASGDVQREFWYEGSSWNPAEEPWSRFRKECCATVGHSSPSTEAR